MRERVRGFTLLEVLVAFAILALTLGVLLSIFSRALRNIDQGKNYSLAVLYAQSKLAEFGESIPLRPGRFSGDFGGSYQWQAQIEPVRSDPAIPVVLYAIHLSVEWGQGSSRRKLDLDTLRLGTARP